MAYPQKIRNAARKFWLLGFSYDKIVPRLAEEYSNEKTPQHARIIQNWHHKENWNSLADAVARIVRENVVKDIAHEIGEEEERDKKLMETALTHIRIQLTRRDREGKPIPLDDKTIRNLVSAADTAIRRKRINRLGYDTRNEHSGEISSTINFEMVDGKGVLGRDEISSDMDAQ